MTTPNALYAIHRQLKQSAGACVLCTLVFATSSQAQTLVNITSPLTIGPSESTITPTAGGPAVPLAEADVHVIGTTLTIDGHHALHSLTVERSASNVRGYVTHTAGFVDNSVIPPVHGLSLDIATDLFIQGPGPSGAVESRIDASVRGFASSQGIDGVYGVDYLSWTDPRTLGYGESARGGGCVRLSVDGTAQVDGSISVVGGSTGAYGHGGSGGSLYVSAAAIAGQGTIVAYGGSTDAYGIGGSGGVVALLSPSNSFVGTVSARGGTTGFNGANGRPGCVYTRDTATGQSVTTFDQGGVAAGRIAYLVGDCSMDGDFALVNNARIGPYPGRDDCRIHVTGSLTVDATSMINANVAGFPAFTGPGRGNEAESRVGAGHGGFGAGANSTYGRAYDSLTYPSEMGSGGRGAGGGLVHVCVLSTFHLDGSIQAIGSSAGTYGSGGSGGSILINCAVAEGVGQLYVNGGWTDAYGRGGAGGRLAVYSSSGTTGGIALFANGASGGQNGTTFVSTVEPPAPGSSGLEFHRDCVTGLVTITATTATAAPCLFQWRKDGQPINHDINRTATSRTLRLSSPSSDDSGMYDCVLRNAAGEVVTPLIPLAFPICPADYDQNGGIDGGDLGAFFLDFEAGEACADVDQNGGIDGGDLGYFISIFEAGGC